MNRFKPRNNSCSGSLIGKSGPLGFSNWRDAQIGGGSNDTGRDVKAWEVIIIN